MPITFRPWIWLIAGIGLWGIETSAQETVGAAATASSLPRSDASVLAVLFDEQHVTESGFSVCRRAAQGTPEERFGNLRTWVIPEMWPTQFRITADFVAGGARTGTASGAAGPPSYDVARLVSPASQLVHLASELDQIDPLRAMIVALPPGPPAEELDRLTLLALIAMEADSEKELEELLDQWSEHVRSNPALLAHSTAGLVLLAQAAIDEANPSQLIREMVRLATYSYRAEYNRAAWLRHLVALSAALDTIEPSEADGVGTASASAAAQWHLASLERAFEHGSAFPAPLWHLQRGRYRNLSNYGDALLFFQSPLLGEFSVEGALTGFGYREAQLVVGGHWTGLVYNHQQVMIGDPRGELNRKSITPPLGDTGTYGFIRTRIDIQDQSAATWMNGRLVHQQPLSQAECPWLAVRTNYRVQGGVDDLRITGAPTIPQRIALVDSPQLLGWYDYYQPPESASHRLGNWEVTVQPDHSGNPVAQISAQQLWQLPRGSCVEHVLRYLRPVIEDGTIAFDFFYEAGQTAAHPVIGRTAYLLTAEGVQRHQLTDGRFDRTELRPDNATQIDASEHSALPLLADQWNRCEINRCGNVFTLVLNGQLVCEERFGPDAAAPQFGIFHFADQTALRVRNLFWTGQWPMVLPQPADQQLANPLEEVLAWTAEQPSQSFHHFFDETSISSGVFVSVEGSPIETVEAVPGGLILRQTSRDGYRGASVAPAIDVSGDFDVMVAFDQVELQSAMERIAAVRFTVHSGVDERDSASIQYVQGRDNERIVQCMRMLTINGNERRSYFAREPAEGNGGRLKLCRRGDKIYYLAADNNSNHFRLIGQEAFSKADLQQHGIRLGVQAQGPASTASVRFTELFVRAERLNGVETSNRQQVLMELDQRRDELPLGFEHDFAERLAADSDFTRWGSNQVWNASDRGLEVVSVGADNWTSTGMAVKRELNGDFDIAFRFSPTQMPTPKVGKQTQVYLQLELTDADRTQVSSILTKNEAGNVFCQMQVRYHINGEYVYKTIGNHYVENADQLRIVRRGNAFYGIAGSKITRSQALLGVTELSDDPIAQGGIRMLLHTGGAGRTAKMLLKSIQIHAEETIGAIPTSVAVPVPQPSSGRILPKPATVQPKSLPGRLFESLRSIFD